MNLQYCCSLSVNVPYTGAEVLYYSNNVGPLYLQDVDCNGTESSYTECSASTDLDPFCEDPSNAVGVRCYLEGKDSLVCLHELIQYVYFSISEYWWEW